MKTVPTETSKVKEIEIGILVEKYRADLLKEVQRGQADTELEQDRIKAELQEMRVVMKDMAKTINAMPGDRITA